MSEFYDLLEEYLGDDDAISDIRIVVRRLWEYDFLDEPVRLWQGQGKLFTSDGNEWLGSITAGGQDIHKAPAIQDGRDGSSATYNFSMTIPDIPGEKPQELYEALKADQFRVFGRTLTCYLAIFKESEALRPSTPAIFFKQLIMQSPKFSEKLTQTAGGVMLRSYVISVAAKDSNSGRSRIPNRTYSDANQKEYARQLGSSVVDRGAEFLGTLANRTYQVP